jgi:hypothetical protein
VRFRCAMPAACLGCVRLARLCSVEIALASRTPGPRTRARVHMRARAVGSIGFWHDTNVGIARYTRNTPGRHHRTPHAHTHTCALRARTRTRAPHMPGLIRPAYWLRDCSSDALALLGISGTAPACNTRHRTPHTRTRTHVRAHLHRTQTHTWMVSRANNATARNPDGALLSIGDVTYAHTHLRTRAHAPHRDGLLAWPALSDRIVLNRGDGIGTVNSPHWRMRIWGQWIGFFGRAGWKSESGHS